MEMCDAWDEKISVLWETNEEWEEWKRVTLTLAAVDLFFMVGEDLRDAHNIR